MIDLETMGLTEDASIVSIGAVVFDPRCNAVTDRTFYTERDWQHQEGRVSDPKVMVWWDKQSEPTKDALHGFDDLKDELVRLASWLPKDCKVWGNGPTFDISKLENAYRYYNLEIPWKYWNIRDCRTIKDIYESYRGGFSSSNGGGAHNALNDAIHQAKYVCYMWKEIGRG